MRLLKNVKNSYNTEIVHIYCSYVRRFHHMCYIWSEFLFLFNCLIASQLILNGSGHVFLLVE